MPANVELAGCLRLICFFRKLSNWPFQQPHEFVSLNGNATNLNILPLVGTFRRRAVINFCLHARVLFCWLLITWLHVWEPPFLSLLTGF